MATRKSTKSKKDMTLATDKPTGVTVIESGVITEASQLDQFQVNLDNVRDWTQYKLDFTEIPVNETDKTYSVSISGSEPAIQQLWHNLFTIDETGKARFAVTTPIVAIAGDNGRYNTVIGNSRILLAQQLKQAQETGLFPLEIAWYIPYSIQAGMSERDILLTQITGNSEVPLSVWNQYSVIKLAVANVEENKEKAYLEIAKSVYPPASQSLGYRLANMYECEQAGLPVQELAKVISNFDTALAVFKKWQALPQEAKDKIPAASIPDECKALTNGEVFAGKHLNLLIEKWRMIAEGQPIAADVVEGKATPGIKQSEPSEGSGSGVVAVPKLYEIWERQTEKVEVLSQAISDDLALDADASAKLMDCALRVEKLLKKMTDILYPKESKRKGTKEQSTVELTDVIPTVEELPIDAE